MKALRGMKEALTRGNRAAGRRSGILLVFLQIVQVDDGGKLPVLVVLLESVFSRRAGEYHFLSRHVNDARVRCNVAVRCNQLHI